MWDAVSLSVIPVLQRAWHVLAGLDAPWAALLSCAACLAAAWVIVVVLWFVTVYYILSEDGDVDGSPDSGVPLLEDKSGKG